MKVLTTGLRTGIDLRMTTEFICWVLIFCVCSCNDNTTKNKDAADIIATYDLKNTEVYLTTKNTEYRLSRIKTPEVKDLSQPDENFTAVFVDPGKTFQTIIGFGGALTDAAAETFYKLSPERQEEVLEAYFDTVSGIGYNLCRTSIHSCDFSSESYSYDEIAGDTLLEHFSILHDQKYRIPFIQKAFSVAGKELKILASPWSPPAWMKTNNSMLQGGKLRPEYSRTWANYYIRFIDAYSKQGIPVWGITVQNEPMAVQTWESCIYTADEEKNFVKNHLGPVIKNSKYPDTKILIWDHNRGLMVQRAKEVYDDPEASQYVWGTAFHWYTGNHFENVKLHNEAFPDKNMLFTEGCVYPFSLDSINEWHWGETYGESILNDLNHGAAGWIDWNILLNESGGPNHVNNFCFAPITGNTKTDELSYMNSYFYLGHFSKFIRRGARRILCSSNSDELQATAFINPDQSVVVVVLNLHDRDIRFLTWMDKKSMEIALPSHSIITIRIPAKK